MIISDFDYLVLLKRIRKKPLEITIISGSMKPLIQIGDKVQVSPTDVKALKPFDIVVYHSEDKKLICHFIWEESKLYPGSLILGPMSGPNSLDLPVPESKILGIVTNKKITFWYKALLILKKMIS